MQVKEGKKLLVHYKIFKFQTFLCRVTQAPQEPAALQAKMAPQVQLVIMVLLAALGCLDQRVMLANQVRRDHLAPRALR